MLVLTRRVGESLVIDGGIRVIVLAINGTKVRLGFEAPPSVTVLRGEVQEREAAARAAAAISVPGAATAAV
ncbi:MAG TPA: carbon storage regulator [Gemmataceae bacterium]|nr:carbon storage regulator [Gemmataceae bacterium]